MEVSVRELSEQLNEVIERVKSGEEVMVTDDGRSVARISPCPQGKLDELIARGLVTPAVDPARKLPPDLIAAQGNVSELVAEQRR